MYGNFDAIKRRQKLRKEKTDRRATTLEKRKDNLLSTDSDDIKKRHSDLEIKETLNNIHEDHKKIKRKQVVLFLVAVILVTLLVIWFYSNHISP